MLSAIALVLANFVPVAGVLFLGWDIGTLMMLFWFENVVTGVFNLLRMLASEPDKLLNWIVKLPVAVFFSIHYGVFCFAHGIFVMALFGQRELADQMSDMDLLGVMLQLLSNASFAMGIAGLLVSHGISFVVNYLMGGEYRVTTAESLMMRPYGRIVALHVTLVLGGTATMMFESPMASLVLLIGLKIGIDLHGHWAEHEKYSNPPGALAGAVLDMDGVNQRLAAMKSDGVENTSNPAKKR